jgi:Uma2 family endonuclease
MGMPHASSIYWTVAMLDDLPDDGNRYEVIDGELFVTPGPTYEHQEAAVRLYRLLFPYVEPLGMTAFLAPAAVLFSTRREVQPDLFVLPNVNGRLPKKFGDVGVLTLAVEVLSPGTARVDRTRKRTLYQAEGVPEYWIVDVATRTVERWRVDSTSAEMLRDTIVWQPIATRPPLVIDLAAYFRTVVGE